MSTQQEIEFGWFLPTTGDGKYIGVATEREATLKYMIDIAQTAEKAGFEFVLIPTGSTCLDAWVVGSAVMSHTETLRPLVAVRPGLVAPVQAARMGAGLDRLSGGRAMFNIVTGSSVRDLEELGDPLAHAHDERYERAHEFVDVMKQAWNNPVSHLAPTTEPLTHKGKYYQFERPVTSPSTVQQPHPPFYLGGSSPVAKRLAVESADTYLMWGEPLDWIREQLAEIETIRASYREETGVDRPLRYGLRAQVLVRDTEEEAWAAAWEIISKVPPEIVALAEAEFAKTDATNQRRQNELRALSKNQNFVVGPNLWTGLSIVRSGGAILIVGTADQVSDRLIEYAELGISSFILSGYPHLEEAEIFGQAALPLFKQKWQHKQLQAITVETN